MVIHHDAATGMQMSLELFYIISTCNFYLIKVGTVKTTITKEFFFCF